MKVKINSLSPRAQSFRKRILRARSWVSAGCEVGINLDIDYMESCEQLALYAQLKSVGIEYAYLTKKLQGIAQEYCSYYADLADKERAGLKVVL